MQSSSSMPPMSPAENLFRRFSDKGFTPRNGQRELIQFVSDNPEQPVYNAVLPTGYGKSKLALSIADVLKQQNRANRMLFIVPTDTQRTQYVEGIKDDIEELGLNLLTEVVKVNGETMPVRAHRENRAEIFVTTVQSILANKAYYLDLMSTGKWLVFCDEYQKLNRDEKAQWGKAVDALPDTVKLGLTATPIRSDGKDTVFANKPADTTVTFEDAYQEKAIRGVIAHVEHYFVDVIKDDDSIERVTTENINDHDLSKDLRLTTKYYASMLSSAVDCWTKKTLEQPKEHQILVFAMGVTHAKSVSDTLNSIHGPDFSDWVGVGNEGKVKSKNEAVLKRYKANKLPCLVQVNIAGEGFDNPRSSVLVFLHLRKKNTVASIQEPGRGIRRNRGIPLFAHDLCDMFASPDTDMAEVIVDFARRTIGDVIPSESDPRGKNDNPPIYDIPAFNSSIDDSEFDRSEITSKLSKHKVDGLREVISDDLKSKYGDAVVIEVTEEMLKKVLVDKHIEDIEKAVKAANTPESWRKRVTEAGKLLAGNVTRQRFGISEPKGMRGDLCTRINSQWVKETGMRASDMYEEEFKQKHIWISNINTTLKETRSIPAWLVL